MNRRLGFRGLGLGPWGVYKVYGFRGLGFRGFRGFRAGNPTCNLQRPLIHAWVLAASYRKLSSFFEAGICCQIIVRGPESIE